MCIDFLYTMVTTVLLGQGETRVSRKGKAPPSLGSSVVSCICGYCVWMSCSSCSLFVCLLDDKGVICKPNP